MDQLKTLMRVLVILRQTLVILRQSRRISSQEILRQRLRMTALLLCIFTQSELASAYTANKVWFEFLQDGKFRVNVNYTVPALKEFREAAIEFSNRKEAEKFYYDLVKGVDFYVPDAKSRRFVPPKTKPEPF